MSPKIKKKKIKKQLKKGAKAYEEYAYILDFSKDRKIAYVIGSTYFHLLEVKLKTENDADLMVGKRVYVGKEKERDSVTYIRKRISGTELTEKARKEAKDIVQQSILTAFKFNEGELYNKFLLFFNHAARPSLRKIGLSRREANILLVARDRKREQGKLFKDFTDIEQELRHAGVRKDRFNLADMITERMIMELMLSEKANERERLLIRFLENPRKSIQESHATI